MATNRNNNKIINMEWRPIIKQAVKYGSAAMVGYEIKDAIESKNTNEEKIIEKIIEKTTTKESSEFTLSKTTALIFTILLVMLAYLIIKHIIKKRTNREIVQV